MHPVVSHSLTENRMIHNLQVLHIRKKLTVIALVVVFDLN